MSGTGPRRAADRQRAAADRQRAAADRQRAAVYAAEQQVARILSRAHEFPVVDIAGSRIVVPADRHFGDIGSVQRYVDLVLGLNWVRARWPAAALPLRVRARRGAAQAHYEPGRDDGTPATIAIPAGADRWALREIVVLHELAHHLGCGRPGKDDDLSHGADFTGRLLELVRRILGPEVHLLLRIAFADQNAAVR